MVSQEVVQTEFSVVHGLTRMHGLTRNEDYIEAVLFWYNKNYIVELIFYLNSAK